MQEGLGIQRESLSLSIVQTHPIPYFTPLFAELARTAEVEVAFFTTSTLRGYLDEGFGRRVQWDVDLTSGYRYRDLGLETRTPSLRQAWALRGAIGQFLDERPDSVVLVPGWTWPYVVGLTEAWRRGMPTILRPEATDLVHRSSWGELKRQTALRMLVSRVDAFAVIGTPARDALRRLGVNDERMRDSGYTIDDRRLAQAIADARPNRDDWRARWSLSPTDVVFLYVAKLSGYKRPLDLVQAFARIAPRHPSARLVIVGDGDLSEAVDRLTAELGIRNLVRRTGFQNQSELPAAYVAANVFVLPSIEPWGLVMNEAAVAGLPLIASELVGAAHDLIMPGITGSRFRPGDIDGLALALEIWMDEDRRARARRCWPDILSRFNIGAAAKGIIAAATLARHYRGPRAQASSTSKAHSFSP
jgi:glycosyltransferase involved in cell wall biosynthesis